MEVVPATGATRGLAVNPLNPALLIGYVAVLVS